MCRNCLTRHLVGLSLTLICWPTGALANDAAFAGPASDLIPIQKTRIKMKSERIVLELEPGQRRWRALATYRLVNPKRKPVTLQVGFPEAHCAPDEECASSDGTRFHGLQTTVRGQPVQLKEGKVAVGTDWAPAIGKVWLFDVTFAPREQIEVVHRYEFYASIGVLGTSVRYNTRAGKLWNGPIGEAEFIVRQPVRPWTVVYPGSFRLQRFEERRVGEQNVTEMIFKMKRWRPKGDLVLHFGNEQLAPLARSCPNPKMVIDAAKTEKTAPGALKRVLSMRTRTDLRLCRNRVYARHGYAFSNTELTRTFYGNKGVSAEVAARLPMGPRDKVIGLRLSKGYTSALLSAQEKAYIEALAEEESSR